MATTLVIEPALKEDYPAVIDVLVAGYMQYQETYEQKEVWEQYLKEIRESVHNPEIKELWVAKIEDRIIGTVQLFETAAKAYEGFESPIPYPFIRLLAVHPDWRGHGVARALLQQCVQSSHVWKQPYVYLYTGERMVQAIGLYEKFGFVKDEFYSFLNNGHQVLCYRYEIEEEHAVASVKQG